LQLAKGKIYRWRVQGFSPEMVAGLATWLKPPPKEMVLKHKLKPTYFTYLDTRENSLDRRPRLSNRT